MAEEEVQAEPEAKESASSERERQDQEKAEDNRQRQLRQGHVSDEPITKEKAAPEPEAKATKSE